MWQVWQWTWSPLFIAALPPWHVPFVKTFQNVLSPRNHSYYQSVFSILRWNPFVSQGLLENPKEKTTFLSKKLEGKPPHPSNSMKTFTFYKRRKWNSIHKNQICHSVWKSPPKSLNLQVFSPRKIETFKNEFLKKKRKCSNGTFWVIFKHCALSPNWLDNSALKIIFVLDFANA